MLVSYGDNIGSSINLSLQCSPDSYILFWKNTLSGTVKISAWGQETVVSLMKTDADATDMYKFYPASFSSIPTMICNATYAVAYVVLFAATGVAWLLIRRYKADLPKRLLSRIRERPLLYFMVTVSAYFLTVCLADALRIWLRIGEALKPVISIVLFCLLLSVLVSLLPYIEVSGKGHLAVAHAHGGKVREPGMDLVRLIAGVFVIAIHQLNRIGYYEQPLDSITLYAATLLRWLFFCCVALFFSISGYFMKKRRLTIQHYIKLGDVFLSYVVIVWIIFCAEGSVTSVADTPVLWEQIINYQASGFLSQYVCLYLLIPFLNIIWSNLSKQGHQVLIVVFLFLTSLNPGFHFFAPAIFLEVYPLTFYFLGAYISEYKPKINRSYLLAGLAVWLLSMTIGSIIFADGDVFKWEYLTTSGLGYQMFPNVIITLLVFLLFYDFPVRGKWSTKLLSAASDVSFEIYLFSLLMDGIVVSILVSHVQGTFVELFAFMPLTITVSYFMSLGAALLLKMIIRRCKRLLSSPK